MAERGPPHEVLVIDVGGSNVKLLLSGEEIPRKFESGPKLTAKPMVKKAKEIAAD
jgi:polyphosphate glucokinase